MTFLKSNTTIFAVLLFATTIVYLNSLSNPFVPDDRGIIFKNFRAFADWRSTDLFGRSLFAREPSESTYFRPLTLLTFGLNYSFAKGSPAGYRIVNISLHLLVVSLTFLLLSGLTSTWVAAFSSLLFALHPVHVQAVSYISSRSDPLYSALALFSLILWHKGNRAHGAHRHLYLLSALAAFFIGLFAKETMVVVPLLALAMDIVFRDSGSWQQKIKDNLFWYVGFLLLFALYFSIRLAEGFPLITEYGRKVTSELEGGLGSRLLLAPKLFALYIGLAFYPAQLHLFRIVPPPRAFFELEVITGFLLVGMSVLMIRLFWKSQHEISFGMLWFLISILPVLNLIRLNADMMEHWLYLPLIGLVLALVSGIKSLAEQVGERRGASIGLILLALLLSARTYTRNAEWGDLVKVFSQNISAYPTHPTAWVWLGDALTAQRNPAEAIRAYKTALHLRPNYQALIGLVDNLAAVGGQQDVEETLSWATTLFPQDPWLLHILAVQQLRAGRNRAAIEAIEKNIALAPSASSYHILASANLRLGEKGKAEEAFRYALLLEPGNPDPHAAVHMGLGRLYQLQGQFEEARAEWTIALRFKPNHQEAQALLTKYK